MRVFVRITKLHFTFIFIFVFSLLFFHVGNVFAGNTGGAGSTLQEEPDPCAPNPTIKPSTDTAGGADFTTDIPVECIDEITQNVKITFHDLTEETEGNEPRQYVICTGSPKCLKKDDFDPSDRRDIDLIRKYDKATSNHSFADDGSGGTGGGPKKFTAPDGELTITVCGDGEDKVKINSKCPDNSDKNYFWGNKTYYVSVGLISDDKLTFQAVKVAGFLINPYYPKIIDPQTGPDGVKLTPASSLNVSLLQERLRLGGKNRNNYQIVFEGGENYKQERCLTIEKANTETSIKEPFKNLNVGKYTLRINEQNNEGGIRTDKCQGGFPYLEMECEVKNTKQGGGICNDNIKQDPTGATYKALLKELRDLYETGATLPFSCGEGKTTGTLPCPSVLTALGPIEVTIKEFVLRIFTYVLTIAGFGAVIIIIYAGYVLMTSRGDKEKIAGARETITSAVVGLLFIILSIVILEIIGVDILRIPGLTR